MATKSNAKGELKGKARIRSEIVEISRGLHKIGAISNADLEKTTLRMLGRDALPKVAALSPSQIVKVREQVGVSQAVLAAYLNVGVSTVSQWERDARRPTSTALKLLQVIRAKGLEVLR